MKVEFLKSFSKDVKRINDSKLRQKIKSVILEIESSKTIDEITTIEKLKGYPNAYRIRVGNDRLGLFYEKNNIELARFLKRNDIYKLFP